MSCKTCKFHNPIEDAINIGECRRVPPTITYDTHGHPVWSGFPRVIPDCWCGEYRTQRQQQGSKRVVLDE